MAILLHAFRMKTADDYFRGKMAAEKYVEYRLKEQATINEEKVYRMEEIRKKYNCVLALILERRQPKFEVYIEYRKSEAVLSQRNIKYDEPEYWKFEEG
ncbi:hypothetical protein Tco_1531300 [Tanacetum coccineum]